MLSFLRKKTKPIMIAVAIVFVGTMFYGLGLSHFSGGAKEGNTDVAKVNGHPINRLRFGQMLSRYLSNVPGIPDLSTIAFFQTLALNQSVEYALALSDAQRHVHVGGGDVRDAIDGMMKAHGVKDRRQFEELLKGQGISWGDFEEYIKDDLLVQKRVDDLQSSISVAPDDLREVRVWHILIRSVSSKEGDVLDTQARKQADDLHARLAKGEDFAALAKQYSQDPGSAVKGGDLGFFGKGMMVKPFEDTAFALKPGELSSVVKTAFGYHILRLEETRLKKAHAKDGDVKKEVIEQKKQQVLSKWREDLRKEAKIETIDPVLHSIELKNQGRLPEAVAVLETASKSVPSAPLAPIYLSAAYGDMGRIDDAVAATEKAVTLRPGDIFIHVAAGHFYGDLATKPDLLQKGKEAALKPVSYYRSQAIDHFRAAAMIAGENAAIRQQMMGELKKLKAFPEVAEQEKAIKEIQKRQAFMNSLPPAAKLSVKKTEAKSK